MSDENNMFERSEYSSPDGLQPPFPEDNRQIPTQQGYQQQSQTGGSPVSLEKEIQPAGTSDSSGQTGDVRPPYSGQQGYQQQNGYQQPYGGQNQSTPLSCSAQPVYQQESQSTISAESGGFGIASMICGILSIITCCVWCLSVPLAIVSIILGILQLTKGAAKGMAIAGIICSGVGLLLMLCFLVWFVVFQASDAYYEMIRDMQYMNFRRYR